MKSRFKLLTRLLIAMLLFSVLSCSEEIYDETISSSKEIKIKEVKFSELFKDKKFNTLLSSLKNNNISNKSEFENQFGFTISDGNVTIIETANVTSYTMLIHREGVNENQQFENLVIQNDIYNNKDAAIYKYIPSTITAAGHHSFNFEGAIEKINVNFGSGSQNTTQSGCYVNQIMCCQSWDFPGTVTEPHFATSSCTNASFKYTVRVLVLCPPDNGPSEPNGGGSIDFWTIFGFGNTPGGGGGGPTDNTHPTVPQDYETPEIVTTPILNTQNSADIRNINLFYQSLTPQQQQWVAVDLNHQIVFNQLIKYQSDNAWNYDSKQFADDMINLCTTNNSSFTLNNSTISPNAINVDTIADFQTLINNPNSVTEITNPTNTNQNQFTATAKFQIFLTCGISVDILQSVGNPFNVLSVASNLYGFAPAITWTPSTNPAQINVSGSTTTIKVKGTIDYDCIFHGIGVLYRQEVIYQVIINNTNGHIISGTRLPQQ